MTQFDVNHDDFLYIDTQFKKLNTPSIAGLKLSPHKVYYFDEYIPVEQGGTPEEKQIRSEILTFKNYKTWIKPDYQKAYIEQFSHKILKGVDLIASTFDDTITGIALIPVPCSKIGKKGGIHDCLNYIRNHSSLFDNDVRCKFYCYNLLKRYQDIKAIHQTKCSRDVALSVHLETIELTRETFYRPNMKIILIDDVTTSGSIMNACTELLLSHQVNIKQIYRLALASTVN